MKIDAYKTLTAMAQSFCNKETAKETPFVLIAMPEEKNGATVVASASTKDLLNMHKALTDAIVGCLEEDGASLFEASAIMAKGVAEATSKHYQSTDIGEALDKLEEMLDDLKEGLENE